MRKTRIRKFGRIMLYRYLPVFRDRINTPSPMAGYLKDLPPEGKSVSIELIRPRSPVSSEDRSG